MANISTSNSKTFVPAAARQEFFGHPKGLYVLFFAEMWERMSYYGMRALLMLYMTTYLLTDPEKFANVIGLTELKSLLENGFGPLETQAYASHIYGLYTGFVYLSPFFGGILADKIWGKRKSVYIGGVLMAIGHFLMAFENLFLPALFFLILGNGAFKPNISTQVGALYEDGDPRRDGAFTLFYMGINLGAFFSPLVCKGLAIYIAAKAGMTEPGAAWHLGFSFAGIGMMFGLLCYHFGRHLLPQDMHEELMPKEQHMGLLVKCTLGFFGIMLGYLFFLTLPALGKTAVGLAVTAAVVMAIMSIKDKVDRSRIAALVVICIGTVFFWAIFEQQGNTLQVWAEQKADWESLRMHAEYYQSLNPLYIFIFAPFLNMWWQMRYRRGVTSSSVIKMAVGCVFVGAAFLIIPLAQDLITVDKSITNLLWLALVTWVVTMGELYLSPIGLSLVTKVAPARLVSMMMGVWFMSSFLGNALGGILGSYYTKMGETNFFLMCSVMGLSVGVFFFLAQKWLRGIVGASA